MVTAFGLLRVILEFLVSSSFKMLYIFLHPLIVYILYDTINNPKYLVHQKSIFKKCRVGRFLNKETWDFFFENSEVLKLSFYLELKCWNLHVTCYRYVFLCHESFWRLLKKKFFLNVLLGELMLPELTPFVIQLFSLLIIQCFLMVQDAFWQLLDILDSFLCSIKIISPNLLFICTWAASGMIFFFSLHSMASRFRTTRAARLFLPWLWLRTVIGCWVMNFKWAGIGNIDFWT